MSKTQIIELLKKLQKFELTYSTREYDTPLEENNYGNWVKFEDVCKLFGIEVDSGLNVTKE